MPLKKQMTNGSRLARAAIIALVPLTLTACKHMDQGPQVAGWSLIEGTQRHPIMVSQEPAVLNVQVARGSQGLTARQRSEVLDFAARYRASDAGNSRLVISAPSGSANEIDAMAAVDETRDLMIQSGFAETVIAVEAYQAEGTRSAPMRVSYMRYVAEGPDCGHTWAHDPNYDNKNLPSRNFACAAQHNLAAQIANPADLLGPRSETPRDASRRDVVYDNYVKGKATASDKVDDEKVKTSGN